MYHDDALGLTFLRRNKNTMCQEKEDEGSPALAIESMDIEDYIKKSKERLIIVTRNNTKNTRIGRTTKN